MGGRKTERVLGRGEVKYSWQFVNLLFFPSSQKKTKQNKQQFWGEVTKATESTNRRQTFYSKCSNYCTHQKLQEWPSLPPPLEKGIFSLEELVRRVPLCRKIWKNGGSLFSRFVVVGAVCFQDTHFYWTVLIGFSCPLITTSCKSKGSQTGKKG